MKVANAIRLVASCTIIAALSGCDYTTSNMAVQLNPGVQSIPLVDKNGNQHNLTNGTVDLNFRPVLGWIKVTNSRADGSTDVFRVKVKKYDYNNESNELTISAPASDTGQKVDIAGGTLDTVIGSNTYQSQRNCTCTRVVCDRDLNVNMLPRDDDGRGDGRGYGDGRGHGDGHGNGHDNDHNSCRTYSYYCGTQTLQCQTDEHKVTGNISFIDAASKAPLGALIKNSTYSADAGCVPLTYCPQY